MAFTAGQQRCIDTLDTSLVVAAGAGSGKTFTLTQRIATALERGAVSDIDQVCAITFTNKAAGELKARIKAELRKRGLLEQALKADEAWISTIHGMCSRILRAHALELGIDPLFKMADAAVIARMKEAALDATLKAAQAHSLMSSLSEDALHRNNLDVSNDAWYDQVDALFAEYPARSGGFGATSVEAMMKKLMELGSASKDGFASLACDYAFADPVATVEQVCTTFQDLADRIAGQGATQAREAWKNEISEALAAVQEQRERGVSVDPQWALASLDLLKNPPKTGKGTIKELALEACQTHDNAVMEMRLALAAPHMTTLLILAGYAFALFSEMKRSEGVLDNNDLLVLAYKALSDYPAIAVQYTDKFRLIMVDEFQDTDQMQVDMIKLLAGPNAYRLCTVGDAQQSIYRFRGADVSVYRKHLAWVEADNPQGVIRLADNFRSHADILAFVDRIFERYDMFGNEFMSLAPARDEQRITHPFPDDVPRIQVQLTSYPSKGASADDARIIAAQRVADTLVQLHDAGCSAGDMAVLLGDMTHAQVYAQALRQRGLACVISGGSVFSGTPEARLVLDLLQVAANPYQTQALFNVLTSPLFCLSASDLLALGTADAPQNARRRNLYAGLQALAQQMRDARGWDARSQDEQIRDEQIRDEQIRDAQKINAAYAQSVDIAIVVHNDALSEQLKLAVRVMTTYLSGVGKSTLSRLIMRVVSDSGWLTRLQEQGAEGLAHAGNVYKAVRMIEDLEALEAVGPARVAKLFQVTLEQSKEAPGALSSSGGDFVRIMTIHASKGLEFPVVAVGEIRGESTHTSKLIHAHSKGKTYLSLDLGNTAKAYSGAAKIAQLAPLYRTRASETGHYESLDNLLPQDECASNVNALDARSALYCFEETGENEEAKRLLYVALTRAKEALVVSLLGKRTKSNPLGTPSGSAGALVNALAGQFEGFEPGMSTFSYGGSADALVQHVALVPEGSDETAQESAQADNAQEADQEANDAQRDPSETFFVPEPPIRIPLTRTPYIPARTEMSSYSALADTGASERAANVLAERFLVSVDDAGEGTAGESDTADQGDAAALWHWNNRRASVVDEDDGSWAYIGSSLADADKATDLGTAFHRLAQYAVLQASDVSLPNSQASRLQESGSRASHGAAIARLRCPDSSKVRALAKACKLNEVQQVRLQQALDRWFASDVARDMGGYETLCAEVPFCIHVPYERPQGSGTDITHAQEIDQNAAYQTRYLEGEIDLLALQDTAASIVDYKTGGSAEETAQHLGEKHALQAACYAYAVLLQGYTDVNATFVRVEVPCAGDASQPQCVRYRFTQQDIPFLQDILGDVMAGVS